MIVLIGRSKSWALAKPTPTPLNLDLY